MKSEICYTDPTKFCEAQLKLLHLEREAEIERTKDLLLATDSQNLCLKKSGELERKGLGLRKLIIQDWTTSSFGKNLLTFAKNVPDTDLPASSIQTGTYNFWKMYCAKFLLFELELLRFGYLLTYYLILVNYAVCV